MPYRKVVGAEYVGLYNRKVVMEDKFYKCIRKYESCAKQLKESEDLLRMINKYINEYFETSEYNTIANEREDNDRDTRIQPKSPGSS